MIFTDDDAFNFNINHRYEYQNVSLSLFDKDLKKKN